LLRYNILSNEALFKILVINKNLLKVREDIASACAGFGRDPLGVALVCVSKNRPVEEIKQALEAGVTDIGESRVQEALLKFNSLRAQQLKNSAAIKWHMIGHLQTNKVKDAVRIFDLIHSVDSFHLALEIEKQAARINKVQEILVEVNTSGEAAKSGVKPGQLPELVESISGLKNIRLMGLMTVAAAVDDPEKARPYFRELKELQNSVNKLIPAGSEPAILSMGMSDDFEVAVEEGSTMVRIGRLIFEGA
jgi:PLP dependent protein